MPVSVAVYVMPGHRRSTLCTQAMKAGIRAVGDLPQIINDTEHKGATHDACVFYGYTPNLQQVMADYRAAAKPAIYIDLGYWSREGSNGHHKVVVNNRHPTEYFQRVRHDAARARRFNIEIKPWRESGEHILVAGMGAKAAVIAEGMLFESFERDAIAQIAVHSARPIVYRPKPSCKKSGPIPGTTFSPPEQPIAAVLKDCHAVVTHHSNVALDALLEGIPAFCWQGVAVPLALQDLSRIETPIHPDGRAQLVNDIAYTQWTWTEMAAGLPWRHLKDEGLIP